MSLCPLRGALGTLEAGRCRGNILMETVGGGRARVWGENPGPGWGAGVGAMRHGAVSLSCGSQATLSHATCNYSVRYCRCYSGGYTKLLINNNYTGGSTVIKHNWMDSVWAQGPDFCVERQRCGQKGDTEKARRANMYISTLSLQQIYDYSSYCFSFLNIYKNIRSKGRGVVGKEYDIKRRVTQWRPNSEGRKFLLSGHMMLVHPFHHFHFHTVWKPSSSFQLLSTAVFCKELDDSSICWENHNFTFFLSSEEERKTS